MDFAPLNPSYELGRQHPVGWVKRSETHHRASMQFKARAFAWRDGFRCAQPILRVQARRRRGLDMSLSSAKNYALRASKAQDQKEAIELLSKAILELASSIETTDAKIKKMNKLG